MMIVYNDGMSCLTMLSYIFKLFTYLFTYLQFKY